MSMDLTIEQSYRTEVSLIDLLGALSGFFSYSQDEEEEFKIKLSFEYKQEQNTFICIPEVLVFVGEEHTELFDHPLNNSYLSLLTSELVDIFDGFLEFLPNSVFADKVNNTSFIDVNREILKLYVSQARASKTPLTIGLDFSFVCNDLRNELEMWVGYRVNDVYYVINETKVYEPFVLEDGSQPDSTVSDLIAGEV